MKTERTLYAVRQKSTGFYIMDEDPMHRTMSLPSANKALIPRLFSTEQSAKRSLTAWVKGHAYQDTDTERNEWTGQLYTVPIGVLYEDVGRNKDDMEVVSVRLILP